MPTNSRQVVLEGELLDRGGSGARYVLRERHVGIDGETVLEARVFSEVQYWPITEQGDGRNSLGPVRITIEPLPPEAPEAVCAKCGGDGEIIEPKLCPDCQGFGKHQISPNQSKHLESVDLEGVLREVVESSYRPAVTDGGRFGAALESARQTIRQLDHQRAADKTTSPDESESEQ